MPREVPSREDIARAIDEGRPIDWEKLQSAGLITDREAAAFRILDLMKRIHSAGSDTPEAESGAEISPVETGFEILEELGRGAYSRVYRAVDRTLGREVALKVLKHDGLLSALDRSRLIREAKTLASLPAFAARWISCTPRV